VQAARAQREAEDELFGDLSDEQRRQLAVLLLAVRDGLAMRGGLAMRDGLAVQSECAST
jgi:hypothetical protein